MFIDTHGMELDEDELEVYKKRGREKYGDTLKGIEIVIDGDEVELHYVNNNNASNANRFSPDCAALKIKRPGHKFGAFSI